jgi:hypothetical protein
MFTSFSTALSALGAHSTAVDVVGNNLGEPQHPRLQGECCFVLRLGHAVTRSWSRRNTSGFRCRLPNYSTAVFARGNPNKRRTSRRGNSGRRVPRLAVKVERDHIWKGR